MPQVYTKTTIYSTDDPNSIPPLDADPAKDIYDLTTRPEMWGTMDRAAKIMLRIDNRRLREKLAEISRIAKGGQE